MVRSDCLLNVRFIHTLSGFGFPLAGFCGSLLQLPLSAQAAATALVVTIKTPVRVKFSVTSDHWPSLRPETPM